MQQDSTIPDCRYDYAYGVKKYTDMRVHSLT